MTTQEAIQHIEALYPPDSQFGDTRAIGRELMQNYVGNSVGYSNWREMPYSDLIQLAKANLEQAGEQWDEYSAADAYIDDMHANAPTPYDP